MENIKEVDMKYLGSDPARSKIWLQYFYENYKNIEIYNGARILVTNFSAHKTPPEEIINIRLILDEDDEELRPFALVNKRQLEMRKYIVETLKLNI